MDETASSAPAGTRTFICSTLNDEFCVVKVNEPTWTSDVPATTFNESGFPAPTASVKVPVPTVMVWRLTSEEPIVVDCAVTAPLPPVVVSRSACHVPMLEPDLMLPTMSIVLEPLTGSAMLTEKVFAVDGEGFVEPICVPVELSTRRRSVIVADSAVERLTTIELMLMPSVEPAESVNEPSLALLVPAIIVWSP